MYTEFLAHTRLAEADVESHAARSVARDGDLGTAARPPAWGQRTTSWTVPDRGKPAWASRSAWT